MRPMVRMAVVVCVPLVLAVACPRVYSQSGAATRAAGSNGYVYAPERIAPLPPYAWPYGYSDPTYGPQYEFPGAGLRAGNIGGFSSGSLSFGPYGALETGMQMNYGWASTGYAGLNIYRLGPPFGFVPLDAGGIGYLGGGFGGGGFGGGGFGGGYGVPGGYYWNGIPLYFGPGVATLSPAPGFGVPGAPGAIPNPFGVPVPRSAPEGDPRGVAPGAAPAAPDADEEFAPPPSNLEAQRRSIRLVAQGDEWFVKQNFLQAHVRYKQAVTAAPDRAEPRFRLGFALVALRHYESAAVEFRRGLKLDPTWPATGIPLEKLYGDANALARQAMGHRTLEGVGQDVSDPDRLFIMGVLLHFNNDQDRAVLFFQTASMLLGAPAWLQPFLKGRAAAPAPAAGPRIGPRIDLPPEPPAPGLGPDREEARLPPARKPAPPGDRDGPALPRTQ